MGKGKKIYPPLDNRRIRTRRILVKVIINILILIGLSAVYYIVFSLLFDTPAEYSLKKEDAKLQEEYSALTDRLNHIEEVLDNVVERDKNVFNILFESEPYDLEASLESSSLAVMDELIPKTNKQLSYVYSQKTASAQWNMQRMEELYADLYRIMAEPGSNIDNIPAIQPILNKELTLLTASFGNRIHPFYKGLAQHNGVDFTVPEGTRVFATADGVVAENNKKSSSAGLTVTIDHGNGYETHYNHLSEISVSKGQRVSRDDIIALTGSSGLSLLPHLHYEIRYRGVPVDPIHYFFMELSPKEYQRLIKIAQSGMQSFD